MELLTGECKKKFESWFLLSNGYIDLSDRFYMEFSEMPLSFQFGVLEDFFDSKGIVIDLPPVQEPTMGGVKTNGFRVYVKGFRYSKTILTRPKARKVSIEKANELYNANNK